MTKLETRARELAAICVGSKQMADALANAIARLAREHATNALNKARPTSDDGTIFGLSRDEMIKALQEAEKGE